MPERLRVLLLETLSVPTGLQEILKANFDLVATNSWAGAISMLAARSFDVVLRHVGEDSDNSIRNALHDAQVIVYGRPNLKSEATEEMRGGVFGFIELPPSPEVAVSLVARAADRNRRGP